MEGSANHIDPLAGMFDKIAERAAEIILEKVRNDLQAHDQSANLSGIELSIHPDCLYNAKDLASRWFSGRVQSVHDISPMELPRKKVGAARGRSLFYGLDILRYEGTITEEQYHAFQENKLKVLESTPKAPAKLRRLRNVVDGSN